jgi:hypothetical protein
VSKLTVVVLVMACLAVGLVAYNYGFTMGKTEGYKNGVNDGLGSGFNVHDPTFEEALRFIETDKTETHNYIVFNGVSSQEYTCFDYCNDFLTAAFDAELKAGFVYIEFAESAHGIVCFDTVDKGLIFVEPQSDDLMSLVVGSHYWDRSIYEEPDYDDTILNFNIIW